MSPEPPYGQSAVESSEVLPTDVCAKHYLASVSSESVKRITRYLSRRASPAGPTVTQRNLQLYRDTPSPSPPSFPRQPDPSPVAKSTKKG